MSYTESGVLTESPAIEFEPKRAPSSISTTAQIEKTLSIGSSESQSRRLKWVLTIALLLLVGAFIYWWISSGSSMPVQYQVQEVVQGNLTLTVTATGNLEAVNTVEVGSEVSGLVDAVYADFNDRVEKGQILAALNIDKLQAEAMKASASLSAAEAAYNQAVATLHEQSLATGRSEQLAEQAFVSEQALESSRAALKRADAAVASAYAQIEVSQANQDVAQTNLGKAEIRSPIDGVVLSRDIEPGQTVAAAFQTPVLFLLAEDLTKMELQVDVDEADVGQVAEGQRATFTVDAYPDKVFPAQITSLHFASQMISGVVTYKAELSVDNDDLLLRPGMTATADITTQTVENALLVPNSALRFTPPGYEQEVSSGEPVVWTLRDDAPVSIGVKTGPTDGIQTVITPRDITTHMQLLNNVVDESTRRDGSEAVRAAHPPTN